MVNNGGPAFPFEHGHSPDACNVRENGMSLRDYFAGQALIGLLAMQSGRSPKDTLTVTDLTWQAYTTADAMLAAREVKSCQS